MKHSILILLSILLLTGSGFAGQKVEKSAIVIASFGTSYLGTLKSIESIVDDVEKAYPHTPVRLAFTSNIIRKIWHERRDDQKFRSNHPKVDQSLYNVKNVLGTIADLQNEGYRNIVVQPTHVVNGEEYQDLVSYVKGLESIKTHKEKFQPFLAIGLGKPLTGTFAPHEQIHNLAKALVADVNRAKKANATLVYMGHGNEHMTLGAYYELELVMNRMYDVPVVIGLVEGQPNLASAIAKLKVLKAKKIVLKPLMIVAGDHANNDMAGDDDDAWKVILNKAGYKVSTVLEGLGDNPVVRKIFVAHLKEAAEAKGIELK